VVLTDNAGVGLSTGAAQKTVAGMARDAASLIDALGLERVAPEGAEASSGQGLEFEEPTRRTGVA
jgi:hypothetical protein